MSPFCTWGIRSPRNVKQFVLKHTTCMYWNKNRTLLDHRFHGKPRGFREQKTRAVQRARSLFPSLGFPKGWTFLTVSLSWGETGFREFIHLGRREGLTQFCPSSSWEWAAKGEYFPLCVSKHCPSGGQSRSRAAGTGWKGLSKEPGWRAHPALTPSYKPSKLSSDRQ